MGDVRPDIGPAYVPGVPSVPRPRRAPLSESRPHPADGGVVGTYVHAYDPSPQPYQSPIPAMRPAQEGAAEQSQTPIYDALYSEFRRAFRTLPGDRSNEEDLRFQGFGSTSYSAGGGFAHPRAWQAALPPSPRRGL